MNTLLIRNDTAGASLRWPYTHVVCADDGKILQLWFEGSRRRKTPVHAVLDELCGLVHGLPQSR